MYQVLLNKYRDFLHWALHDDSYVDGSYTTGTIEEKFSPDMLLSNEEAIELATIAGCITAYNTLKNRNLSVEEGRSDNVWRRAARIEGLRKPRM